MTQFTSFHFQEGFVLRLLAASKQGMPCNIIDELTFYMSHKMIRKLNDVVFIGLVLLHFCSVV